MNKANVILVIIGALILLTPPADPDFGWHYKYGEYFVQTGKILRDNIFSYTLPDYMWANSYWISEIILYLMYTRLGAFLMSVVLGLVLSAAIVYINRKQSPVNKFLILIFFTTLLAEFTITVRPLFFSTIFFIFLFHTLLNYPKTKKLFYFLPMLFLLWANMHADFIIGLAILAFFTASSEFDRKRILVTMLAIAATLINPYGIHLWTTLLLEATPEIIGFKEFAPAYDQSSGVVLISSGILLLLYLLKKENLNWFAFVLVGSFLLGVKSVYFYRVFLLSSLFVLSQISPIIDLKRIRIIKKPAVIGIIILAPIVILSKVIITISDIGTWATQYKYPYGAVTYIKTNPIQGNMFNHYDWGGFLIWQLPEYKTFIDGRMAAWRDADEVFFSKYKRIRTKPYENAKLLDDTFSQYNITWLLDTNDSILAEFLIKERNWKTAYSNDNEIIVKKT